MKADGTLRIAYVEARSGILTVRAESAYDRNDFDEVVYRKQLSTVLFQVKLIKDAGGALHAFSSNLQEITDIPGSKPRLPQRQPCDPRGSLFHSFERPNGDWDTDRQVVSTQCLASFALELDQRAGRNTIHVAGIDVRTGAISVTDVPGGELPVSAPPYVAQTLTQPDTGFFYICTSRHKDGTPQLFAIDSTGNVFQARKTADQQWAELSEIAQRPIMRRAHRGIAAERDYTGCIRIYVHAADNFAYVCEQEQPNGDSYIGWMNV